VGLWSLIKLGLIALAVWLLYKSARRFLGAEGSSRGRVRRQPGPDGVIDVMVQDPQCGTYLPKQEAIRAWVKGEERHFCSEACRDAFIKGEPAGRPEEEE
jgi:YHS domain-containing protein